MRPILRKAERQRLAKELTARISAVGTLSESPFNDCLKAVMKRKKPR